MADQAQDLALLSGATSLAGAGAEPPKERTSPCQRQRRVAYALLAPGAIYLALAFLVRLRSSCTRRSRAAGCCPAASPSPGSSRTTSTSSASTAASSPSPWCIPAWRPSSASCSPIRWRTGSPSTRGAGKRRCSFMILVPFFVSFVIRTVQWKFLLATTASCSVRSRTRAASRRLPRPCGRRPRWSPGSRTTSCRSRALPLYVALDRIDRRLVEAAKDLYATKFEAFRKVVLAAVVPGAVRRGDPHVRAGDRRLRELLDPRIGSRHDDDRSGDPDGSSSRLEYPEAAALSVILMLGMLVIAVIYARRARHRGRHARGGGV